MLCIFAGNLIINRFNTIKDKVGEFQYIARVLVAFMVKLLGFFHTLCCRLGIRRVNIHPVNLLEPNQDLHLPAEESIEEDNHVLPCLQRLQRLETLFEELGTKSMGIPLDKEQLLLESLDRIKSVEFDLEKTKRVSEFTHFRCLDLNSHCLSLI